jgi:3-oxoacyl-[acyl-carrier protein] reductase
MKNSITVTHKLEKLFCDRSNPVALDSVKAMLTTGESQHHHVLVADFNRPDSLKAVLDGYLAQTSPVHILVNTSGGPPPGLAC